MVPKAELGWSDSDVLLLIFLAVDLVVVYRLGRWGDVLRPGHCEFSEELAAIQARRFL